MNIQSIHDQNSTPLTAYRYLDEDASESGLNRSLQCRKLLLEADADPTRTPTLDDYGSPISDAIGTSSFGQGSTASPPLRPFPSTFLTITRLLLILSFDMPMSTTSTGNG